MSAPTPQPDDDLLPYEWLQSWLYEHNNADVVGITGHTQLCVIGRALAARYPGRRHLVYGSACQDATSAPYMSHRFAPWLKEFEWQTFHNTYDVEITAKEAKDILYRLGGPQP